MFPLLPNLPPIRLCWPGRPHHSQPSSYALCQAWWTTPRILYICKNTGWKLEGYIYTCLKTAPLGLVGGCEEENFFHLSGIEPRFHLLQPNFTDKTYSLRWTWRRNLKNLLVLFKTKNKTYKNCTKSRYGPGSIPGRCKICFFSPQFPEGLWAATSSHTMDTEISFLEDETTVVWIPSL